MEANGQRITLAMIDTLNDLLERDGRLQIICKAPACTHEATIWADRLAKRISPRATIENIRRHLKCSACGAGSPTMNVRT